MENTEQSGTPVTVDFVVEVYRLRLESCLGEISEMAKHATDPDKDKLSLSHEHFVDNAVEKLRSALEKYLLVVRIAKDAKTTHETIEWRLGLENRPQMVPLVD